MKSTAVFASTAALVLLVPASVAAGPPTVRGDSFDAQAHAVKEGLQVTQDAGVFGRPGDATGEEGPRRSAIGDRELDRYVSRLAFEIRMRNAIADRDPAGFR